MKIGIISFAHMHAYTYAELLSKHSDAEVHCVWDADEERGRQAASQFGAVFYSDLDSFLQQPIEAVLVCSENANHKEHVVAAARAKKHILCEKPIATEVEDAEEMIRVCKENGVKLQIAFPVRYSSAVMKAKSLIESGELGEILAINSTNHGKMPGGWFVDPVLAGGGAAADHIVHLMDIVHWITGSVVKRAYAELDTRYYDLEVEDCGIIMLELESGTIMTIDPSWSRPASNPTWGDLTMEVVGEAGTLTLDIYKQSSQWFNNEGEDSVLLPWLDDLDSGLIDDFIRSVKENLPPAITGEDGLKALQVVKACYEAHKLGAFVELS